MNMMGRPRYFLSKMYWHDFVKLYRKEKNARVKIRFLGLFHLQQGRSYKEVAQILQVEATAPQRWVKRLARGGIAALQEQPGRGRKRKLKLESQEQFCEAVEQLQEQRQGGRARARDVQELLKEKFKADYALSGVYHVLHRSGLSWITARSKHPKADIILQETFKKTSYQR
jgi:transposase